MNTLAYIKLNKPKGEELDHVKRNAWLFVRAEEGENQDIAIARMKLFSSVCEADGFHIIGESVFIGNETGAKHIIKSYIPRILFVAALLRRQFVKLHQILNKPFLLWESFKTRV